MLVTYYGEIVSGAMQRLVPDTSVGEEGLMSARMRASADDETFQTSLKVERGVI